MSLRAVDCTFAGDTASKFNVGGGICNVGGTVALESTLDLRHCTVTQNTGNGRGGGLYPQSPATVNLHSCLISGNADAGGNADIFKVGGTLTALPRRRRQGA